MRLLDVEEGCRKNEREKIKARWRYNVGLVTKAMTSMDVKEIKRCYSFEQEQPDKISM